jgi:hypothetical protein
MVEVCPESPRHFVNVFDGGIIVSTFLPHVASWGSGSFSAS